MNIFALSSGRGPCGIAIIRMSGPDTLSICKLISKEKKIKENEINLCRFFDPSNGTIIDAATSVGAQGAPINYARGTGVRDRMGLMGVTIDEQKEIIRIIVSKEQSNRVFESMYLAGKLDTPGKGIMWMVKLDRVATHIPKDVMKRVGKV